MQNMINPRTKQSWLLLRMNSFLNLLFVFYFLLITGLWIGHIVSEYKSPFVSYLSSTTRGKIVQKMSVKDIIESFFYFFIMYSHIIPISIYVAIEILKFLQTRRIDPPLSNKKPVENRIRVQNAVVLENLGQINTILTDKTGTLTNHNLTLQSVYTDGRTFGNCEQSTEKASQMIS